MRRLILTAALLACSVNAQVTANSVMTGPFFAPIETSGKPQTFHQRFTDYSIAAFGPQTMFIPPLWASLKMADPPKGYPDAWRTGAGAFGRNFGNALAWRTSLESAQFVTGALLHEDFRYRKSTSRNPLLRGFHAVAFTFVDKSDSGRNQIAIANFAGAAASGFVGNLYLPSGYNNAGHGVDRFAIAFAGLTVKNLLREFIPERAHPPRGWQAVFLRHPVPEWWIKASAPTGSAGH